MTLTPKSDKCIFRPDEVNKGGLIIVPDTNQSTGVVGTIVAVGPDAHATKPGDRVVIARFAGFQLEYAASQLGKEYEKCRLIRELDVLATVKEEE